ncbi:MAG: hypothetical protein IPG02_16990 [Ignavibacteria bacterium]|nr:hypothetical protein [Ignavibacteria bacterium]
MHTRKFIPSIAQMEMPGDFKAPEWYALIPADEKLPIHSSKFVVSTLDTMVEHGLIVQYLGQHYDSKDELTNKNKSELTKIHPTDYLKQQLNFLTIDELVYVLKDGEIILRDSEGVSIPFDDTPDIVSMRNDLVAYNDLLGQSEIQLAGLVSDDRSLHTDYLLRNTYYNYNNARNVRLRPMRVRRIFNVDFDHGGRFYGGIENMPSGLRPKLTINGQPTVELDFASYQLRMLYHKVGIDYRRDAYAVAAGYRPEHRDIYKSIVLIALNAENEFNCLAGIRNDLWEKGLDNLIGGTDDVRIKPLLTNLINAHAPISEYMYSGIGLELQRTDSDIANCVLKKFRERGVLVLSVHDSFVIEAARVKELKRVMRSCYLVKFGFYPVIK